MGSGSTVGARAFFVPAKASQVLKNLYKTHQKKTKPRNELKMIHPPATKRPVEKKNVL